MTTHDSSPSAQMLAEAEAWLVYLAAQNRPLFTQEVRPSIDVPELTRKYWTQTDHSALRSGIRAACADAVTRRRAEILRLGLRALNAGTFAKLSTYIEPLGLMPRWKRLGQLVSVDFRYFDGCALAADSGVMDDLEIPAWDMWVGMDEREGVCKVLCWVPLVWRDRVEYAVKLSVIPAMQWE